MDRFEHLWMVESFVLNGKSRIVRVCTVFALFPPLLPRECFLSLFIDQNTTLEVTSRESIATRGTRAPRETKTARSTEVAIQGDPRVLATVARF